MVFQFQNGDKKFRMIMSHGKKEQIKQLVKKIYSDEHIFMAKTLRGTSYQNADSQRI